jgi:hypothetical protein
LPLRSGEIESPAPCVSFVVLAVLLFRAVAFADQPAPIRPDPKLTPGATFDVTLQDISEPGYSKKIRNVTAELKREVYDFNGLGIGFDTGIKFGPRIISSSGTNSIKHAPTSLRIWQISKHSKRSSGRGSHLSVINIKIDSLCLQEKRKSPLPVQNSPNPRARLTSRKPSTS